MHQLKQCVDDTYTMYLLPASKPLRSTYCALCGVDLRGRFHQDRKAGASGEGYKGVKPEDTRWLSNVRALRGREGAEAGTWQVDRSEVGTYDAVQYFGSDVLLIGPRVVPLYTASTVPVHDACSEILFSLARDRDLGSVWQSIQCRRALDGRHVRGCGLAGERQGIWWEEVEGEEYLVTNPLKSLSVIINTTSPLDDDVPSPLALRRAPDFFAQLPAELVFHILSFLIPHPTSLLSLRHAIPSVFRLSPSAGNHFWHRVILSETEDLLPEIQTLLTREESTEEGKAFAIWRALRVDRGVRNRRRIARLVIGASGAICEAR